MQKPTGLLTSVRGKKLPSEKKADKKEIGKTRFEGYLSCLRKQTATKQCHWPFVSVTNHDWKCVKSENRPLYDWKCVKSENRPLYEKL